MKYKHVKKLLIGTAGALAISGAAVVNQQALHSENAVEQSTSVLETTPEKENENLTQAPAKTQESSLYAGVKQMESRVVTAEDIQPTAVEQVVVAEGRAEKNVQSADSDIPENPMKTENVLVDETGEEALSEAIAEEITEEVAEEIAAGEETGENHSSEEDKKTGTNRENTNEEEPEEDELVIATVNTHLNIRSEASTEGEILGKLYNHSVGTLLEEAEDGWYCIKSGSVEGYVKGDYVKRGEEGAQLAQEVGERLASVEAVTLRVRQEPTTESDTIGLLPEGEILTVAEEVEGWAKVETEMGEGYISTDYATVYTKNTVAESREEEEARLMQEEEERRAREEAEAAARVQTQNVSTSAGTSVAQKPTAESQPATDTNAAQKPAAESNPTTEKKPTQSQSSGTSLGSQIANYALQFVGNPYVYGGTSLTNGADCSGFVMSVYKHFGITLPRTSGEQGQCGTAVSGLSEAKPGDLIWYSGHIGIYIGDGKIVHASSPKSGIKVSQATYRTILSIRRIV